MGERQIRPRCPPPKCAVFGCHLHQICRTPQGARLRCLRMQPDRSLYVSEHPNPDCGAWRGKKTRQEIAGGVFRSRMDPQPPRVRARVTPSRSGEFEQADNQGDDATALNPQRTDRLAGQPDHPATAATSTPVAVSSPTPYMMGEWMVVAKTATSPRQEGTRTATGCTCSSRRQAPEVGSVVE